MSRVLSRWIMAAALIASGVAAAQDEASDVVDTKSLKALPKAWATQNPYRGDAAAIKVGSQAYRHNCARCHGADAVAAAGNTAPDLRKLGANCPQDNPAKLAACTKETDGYFATSVRKGKIKNGAVYMPPFDGLLNQEAVWAIKAYLETRTGS